MEWRIKESEFVLNQMTNKDSIPLQNMSVENGYLNTILKNQIEIMKALTPRGK